MPQKIVQHMALISLEAFMCFIKLNSGQTYTTFFSLFIICYVIFLSIMLQQIVQHMALISL